MDMGIEFEGDESLHAALDDVEDRWTGDLVARVGTNKHYGPAIEFGRGPIKASGDGVLRFEIDGEVIFAKEVGPADPQPFLRPAFEEVYRNLGAIAKQSDSLEEFLTTVALRIEAEAKRRAPVDDGPLRASITWEFV